MAQDKYSSFGQGLTQGLSLVANMDQMKQQREQRQWENDYKMSAAALELGSKESLPAAMRMNAINNGFIPVWNKYKPMAKMEPVTEADFGNEAFLQTLNQVSKTIGDKKMNEDMRLESVTHSFMDFHAKRGNVKEAQELAMNLVKGQAQEAARTKRAGITRASISGFTGANLIAYRNQLARQLEVALPDEMAGIQAQITDVDGEIANRRNKGRPSAGVPPGVPAPSPAPVPPGPAPAPSPSPASGGNKYDTPDDVKAAYKSGTITKEKAMQILQADFGMK